MIVAGGACATGGRCLHVAMDDRTCRSSGVSSANRAMMTIEPVAGSTPKNLASKGIR